ncbi:hypothetical protein C9Z70_24455 [Escherichia coli]|nr:hypothetical protein C9Z76_26035 [Escherichia coli]TJP95376.1 hypothetical protein C9Z70_24455 [Escherichia coli]
MATYGSRFTLTGKLQLSVLFKLLHKNTITPDNTYITTFHLKCIFFYSAERSALLRILGVIAMV